MNSTTGDEKAINQLNDKIHKLRYCLKQKYVKKNVIRKRINITATISMNSSMEKE